MTRASARLLFPLARVHVVPELPLFLCTVIPLSMTQMSAPGTSSGSGVPTGAQQPPPPPARVRRTHTPAGVIAALRNLPKASKRQKNTDITARNAERALKRAQHAEDAA